jgi:branched-chain amino acid aminotransferase
VIGKGSRGPITEKLQKAFFDIVHGDAPDKFGWLTRITKNEPVTV